MAWTSVRHKFLPFQIFGWMNSHFSRRYDIMFDSSVSASAKSMYGRIYSYEFEEIATLDCILLGDLGIWLTCHLIADCHVTRAPCLTGGTESIFYLSWGLKPQFAISWLAINFETWAMIYKGSAVFQTYVIDPVTPMRQKKLHSTPGLTSLADTIRPINSF